MAPQNVIYFKKADEKSYTIYRQITQLIDLYTVDYNSLKLHSRYLVAASIFLVLCVNYEVDVFLKENINKFDFNNEFFINFINEKRSSVDDDEPGVIIFNIYSDFLQQSFNLNFDDSNLIECLVYGSKFLNFEYNFNLPLVLQGNNESVLENVKY